MSASFSSAHRFYVKSLYKRYLKNELDWCIRRDVWRRKALEIRAEFESNRLVILFFSLLVYCGITLASRMWWSFVYNSLAGSVLGIFTLRSASPRRNRFRANLCLLCVGMSRILEL